MLNFAPGKSRTHSSMDQNMGFRFPRLGFDSLWVYREGETTIQWESLRVL